MTTAPPSNSLPPLPRFSLAPQVFDWCGRYIRQPDGPDAGGPWQFTQEQRRFLFYFYAIDQSGRWLWSRAVLRRPKGWGKTPYMAAIALAELCGPVRFGGWRDGAPLAVPVSLPLVQLAGVSLKQTDNTMSMVLAMIHESPIIDDYGLDPGLTRIYSENGGKLEPLTASSPTAEGAKPSFVVMDETHLWKEADGGHKLAQVIRRNLGKSREGAARSVETTNAHQMGEDSVAERSFNAWVSQVAAAEQGNGRQTILYDSREAPADTDLRDDASLSAGLTFVYGDSRWVDFPRIKDEVWDPSTPPSEARRFYLNQSVVAEDAWVRPDEWDRLAEPQQVDPDTAIALGFDGSKSDDNTALVACRINDGYIWPLLIIDPKRYGGEVPRPMVQYAVERAFETFDVVAFLADVAEFQSYIDTWNERWGEQLCVRSSPKHAIAFEMRGNKLATAQMIEAMYDAIVERQFRHDGNPVLAQHVKNARRRPGPAGMNIGKESAESPNKIDAAVAAALARKARQDYLALPESKKRKRRKSGGAHFD